MEHNDHCKGLEENQLRGITHFELLDGTTDCNCGCHLTLIEIRRKVEEATKAVGAKVIHSLPTTITMPGKGSIKVDCVTYKLPTNDAYKQLYDMLDPWIRKTIEAAEPSDVYPQEDGTVEFTFKLVAPVSV